MSYCTLICSPSFKTKNQTNNATRSPCKTQVAEALHEQIADLSNLVAELKGESLQHRKSSIMEELGEISGPGQGSDGLLLPSQELKRGSVVEESDAIVPPYPDPLVSGRRSVSVRSNSDVSVRNSFAEAGA